MILCAAGHSVVNCGLL